VLHHDLEKGKMKHVCKLRQLSSAGFALAITLTTSQSSTCQLATRATVTNPSPLNPSSFARVGSVDERFQSYNIEMVEVTGGRFWKPYASKVAAATAQKPGNAPAGMDPGLFEYRPPIDLTNTRLRKLAAALGPAYLRVSGTWANTTFFQNNESPAPATPPKGFNAVLTLKEWKGVVDFSRAVDAGLVTSFAISPGVRDASGAWTPDQAQQLLDATRAAGGAIAAAEFFNEPNIASMGGAPKGYDAAAYARDITSFRAFLKKASPNTILLGPGSVMESSQTMPSGMGMLSSADLLTATGPQFDAFSYHSYGAVSSRCSIMGPKGTTTADAALSGEWLARSGQIEDYYGGLRDRFVTGKPIWLTETAQTACGGDRWASTFLDTFRYLNQLGTLARRGVQVHMHNTLAASDYGLLDENTYAPRPNYWAALLWHRLMGPTVLNPGPSPAPALHLYAQCLPGAKGGATLLAVNASRDQPQTLEIAAPSKRFTLSATNLDDKTVQLNGTDLALGSGDTLPELNGTATRPGQVTLAPATITFFALERAGNASCR
jgi:hypothetical protein